MEITHDYVDYQTALLLKFHLWRNKTDRYYTTGKTNSLVTYEVAKGLKEVVSAPEHWQVIKFLRQKYNLHISIVTCYNNKEYTWSVRIGDLFENYEPHWENENYRFLDTPEEAELEAIKYCLNNLIDGK